MNTKTGILLKKGNTNILVALPLTKGGMNLTKIVVLWIFIIPFILMGIAINCCFAQAKLYKKLTSVGYFPREMEGDFVYLYTFKDQYTADFVDKIKIIDRKISYQHKVDSTNYYMLKKQGEVNFIPFFWHTDLVLKSDSTSFYKTVPLKSDLNNRLMAADSIIKSNWGKRVIWLKYKDSIRTLPSTTDYEILKSRRIREDELTANSFNEYIELLIKYICDNPDSEISLHYLQFNHLLIPKNKSDSIIKNVLSAKLKVHPMFRYPIVSNRMKDESKWELKIGARVPNFEAMDINGRKIVFHDLLGEYVLLDFWGTWCKPCVASIPFLKKFYFTEHNQNFQLISVACESDPNLDKFENYVMQKGLVWPQIFEHNSKKNLSSLFGIYSFPTLVLIDPNGFIADIVTDENSVKGMLDYLNRRFKKS